MRARATRSCWPRPPAIRALAAWLPVLRARGCGYWPGGRFLLPRANPACAPDGSLADPALRESLARFMAGFVAFVRETRRES